ncbi:hypothetical protein SAMN05444354_13760 [Stigmatella aurantiaca]|uniref:Uncharacterized protein n=1 Tax=Stigmatella aurantiaca TaxID=41 RepID=A0A1H8FJR8_STIAU|nr:hypothetical protein SAMN05444354_13760 [Stigmatella aurantiaca]
MAWMSVTCIDTPPTLHSTRSFNGRRYSMALIATTLLLGAVGLTRPAYAGGHTDESLEFRRQSRAALEQAEPRPPTPTSPTQPVTPPAEPSQERKDCLAEFEYDRKMAIDGCEPMIGYCPAREGCQACKVGVMLSFETRRASACPMP